MGDCSEPCVPRWMPVHLRGMMLQHVRSFWLVGPDLAPLYEDLKPNSQTVRYDEAISLDLSIADARNLEFDAIVVQASCIPLTEYEVWVALVLSLSRFGAIFFLADHPAAQTVPILTLVAYLGLQPYWGWQRGAMHGLNLVLPEPTEPLDVVMAVRQGYDPVLHAREVFKAKHTEWALELLANVPDHILATPELHARAAAEKELYLLVLDRARGPEDRLNRFCYAQREFYAATNWDPYIHQAYLCHAEFWRTVGNSDMARRILRSIQHARPDPALERLLGAVSLDLRQTAEKVAFAMPCWSGEYRPRILMISHEHSDYGADTLYHGLCAVLGDASIVEFPWKPTLHGGRPELAVNYPCVFEHEGEPHNLEQICAMLSAGEFDLVVYNDTLMQLKRDMVQRLAKCLGKTPLVIIDMWDDGGDYQADVRRHIGIEHSIAYFKREMLACCEYGEPVFPLPFSYPDEMVDAEFIAERTRPFFWAGKRQDGLRKLYLEYLEQHSELDLNSQYTQAEYARVLGESCIGLSLFGLGFDTVRYWELPAHGCLLLAEHSPLRIPCDFEDGVSAAFFDSLPDLEAKLDYYLHNLDRASAIAARGYEHLKKYHTSSARARQFLGCVEQTLKTGG